ncbi:Gfo/Idh/MocA family oxidoreductase [Bacillus sp. FSL M8-0025]|uniref:Gfo/Idh/MocA family protein n=1 Tax=Bacillus sp. FSL M8-0025 TaxID=2921564 RepID=UPI0030D51D14
MLSIALIGMGSAGSRFLRAILYREKIKGDVKLVAICDRNRERLQNFYNTNIKTYQKVNDLLINGAYDIIVIATNENSHFNILKDIKKYSTKYKRILVEKLLVEKFNQVRDILSIYDENEIAVHFVERHSLILKYLLNWMQTNNLTVKRASFFWGKFRLYDHRPTIGVTSEISHPIDLILMISNIKPGTPFEILGGTYVYSDFSISGKQVLDTINVNLKIGNEILVNGSSSFLWEKRRRNVQFYLANSEGIVTYMVVLIFDKPHWDMDICRVYKVNLPYGRKRLINTWKVNSNKMISELFCVHKTSIFIDENVNEIKGLRESFTLAKLSSSAYVQEIVSSLHSHSELNLIDTPIFGEKTFNLNHYKKVDEAVKDYLTGKIRGNDFAKIDENF